MAQLSDLKVSCDDVNVLSFYTLNGKNIAPLAMEKRVGNGKIIFVNAGGYLRSMVTHPQTHDFPTISILTDAMEQDNMRPVGYKLNNKKGIIETDPIPQFYGNSMNVSGEISIKSQSILFGKDKIDPQTILVTKNNQSNDVTSTRLGNTTHLFSDIPLENVKLYGDYSAQFHTHNIGYNASSWNFGYFVFNLPAGSNLTISLNKDSLARIVSSPGNHISDIIDSKVEIKNISSPVSVMLKNPIVKIDGNLSFDNIRSHNPNEKNQGWVELPYRLEISGNSTIQFDHVSIYDQDPRTYLTYFKWLSVDLDNAEETNKFTLVAKKEKAELMNVVAHIMEQGFWFL